MSDDKTAMIEILASILSRLVNVALCLVLTSIADIKAYIQETQGK